MRIKLSWGIAWKKKCNAGWLSGVARVLESTAKDGKINIIRENFERGIG